MTHMTLAEVMTTDVAVVRSHTPFKEIARVMAERQVSALPVLDEEDRLVGVVSEADLLPKEEHPSRPRTLVATPRARHLAEKAAGDSAYQLMTRPAITAPPDMLVAEAARTMDRLGVKRLVVVDQRGNLAGIVSRRDLLKVFLRPDDEIREEIRREVFARLLWADPTRVDIDVDDGIVVLSGEVEQRTSIEIAVRLTRGIDGVVDVVDHLTYVIDDRVVRSLI
jgi:CBS-domain-containing membrane protein